LNRGLQKTGRAFLLYWFTKKGNENIKFKLVGGSWSARAKTGAEAKKVKSGFFSKFSPGTIFSKSPCKVSVTTGAEFQHKKREVRKFPVLRSLWEGLREFC